VDLGVVFEPVQKLDQPQPLLLRRGRGLAALELGAQLGDAALKGHQPPAQQRPRLGVVCSPCALRSTWVCTCLTAATELSIARGRRRDK
jgi:hypothetical protein